MTAPAILNSPSLVCVEDVMVGDTELSSVVVTRDLRYGYSLVFTRYIVVMIVVVMIITTAVLGGADV